MHFIANLCNRKIKTTYNKFLNILLTSTQKVVIFKTIKHDYKSCAMNFGSDLFTLSGFNILKNMAKCTEPYMVWTGDMFSLVIITTGFYLNSLSW